MNKALGDFCPTEPSPPLSYKIDAILGLIGAVAFVMVD